MADPIKCSCCGRLIENAPDDNASYGEDPHDQGYGLCIECSRYNLKDASWKAVTEIANERQYAHLAWEDEKLLLVDTQTANAMVLVHDALNKENQQTLEQRVSQNRVWFLAYVHFCWEAIG